MIIEVIHNLKKRNLSPAGGGGITRLRDDGGGHFYLLLLVFVFVNTNSVYGQNLEKIGKKEMVTVGGSFALNSIYYDAWGMEMRRDPFTWYFNGSLNINILDVALPFTYSYTNNQHNYAQPFNMTSCSPTYKWVKAHIGQTSMTFSPYTLSGHVFLGGGLELTPGKWKISGMYGRLKKVVEYDFENQSDINMSYKRMGYGVKIGYEAEKWGVSLVWFSAKDEVSSLDLVPPVTQIKPMNNTVLSLGGRYQIFKNLKWDGEFALSGLTSNTLAEADSLPTQRNYLPLIFKTSSTSRFYSAGKTSVTWTLSTFSLGAVYERISPGYLTLGGYYFNNDIENITLTPSFKLMKGKLNVVLNTGVQHNNLNGYKMNTTWRWVGNSNLSYIPSTKWVMVASYSNFSTFTRQRPVTDPFYQLTPADTLEFFQLSQTAMVSISRNFGSKEFKQVINLTGTYTVAQQRTGSVEPEPVTVINLNTGYNLNITQTKWAVGATVNYNQSLSGFSKNEFIGPGLNASKVFLSGKLRTTAGSVYNLTYMDGVRNGEVINNRLSLNYALPVKAGIPGKPSITLSAMHLMRFQTDKKDINELTVTANLNYSF